MKRYRLDTNAPGVGSQEFETAGEVIAAYDLLPNGWQIAIFKNVLPHVNVEIYWGMKGSDSPPRMDRLIDARYDSNE